MLELAGSQRVFTFPEVHPDARCEIEFQRTLRIPDDDATYPLPPGLGRFPVRHIDDFRTNLSANVLKRGGVMIPMYQSEALWIRFRANYADRQDEFPFAVKIAVGKRSAVTGRGWAEGLEKKDYVVVPRQPWIDGFVVAEGVIRQFVAAPLGMGFTVEEQLTGETEFGGLQIEVYPMKGDEFERRFPKRKPEPLLPLSLGSAPPALYGLARLREPSMGMAAGGRMMQHIYADPYGLDVWELAHKSRTFVHLMNSMAWKQITREQPPTVPPTAKDYASHGLPWFDYYSEAPALSGTSETDQIQGILDISTEKGFSILPENESVDSDDLKLVGIHAPERPNTVRNGEW